MIVVRFNDRDIEVSKNPKATRAWLRKNGLSIRNGTKESPTLWVFNRNAPVTVPKTNPLFKATIDIAVHSPKVTQEQVNEATAFVQRQLDTIENMPVLGADLRPYDSLVNFVPGMDLTIDYRGLVTITHEAENITRQTQSYHGFYSIESGGYSSFKIDLKRLYDVRRS